jgi:hypothetical protein
MADANYIDFFSPSSSAAQQTMLGLDPKLQQKLEMARLLLSRPQKPIKHWSDALPNATNMILGSLLGGQAKQELKSVTDKYQTDYAAMLAAGQPGSWTNPDTGVAKEYGGGVQGMIKEGVKRNNPFLMPTIQSLQLSQYKTDEELKKLKALEDYKANVLLSPDKEAQTIRINQSKKPLVSIDMAGQNAFSKQFNKEQATILMKDHAVARKAAENILAINKMREAQEGGMYQGGGANLKATAANWLKGFGFIVDDETLANTGLFKSAAGKFLLDHAKELGANPSNADAKRIDQIVGTIDTDPGAMIKMMDFMEEMARRGIRQFNTRYKQATSQPDMFSAYDMSIEEPPAWQPKGKSKNVGAGSGASDDDYLNPRLPSGKKGLFEGEDGEFRFYSSPDDQTLWGLRLSDGSWQQLTKDGQAIPIQQNSDKNTQAAPQKKDLYTLTPEAKDNWEAIYRRAVEFLEQATKWRDDWNAQKESGNSKAQPSAAPQGEKSKILRFDQNGNPIP